MTATTARARWLDADLPITQRVELLLAELTLEEKAGQLQLGFELDPVKHHDEIAAGRVGAGIYSHGANAVPGAAPIPLASTIASCQRVAREESRLGIPLLFGSDVVHGLRTTFPIPLGLAATWDVDLVRECAAQAALEARGRRAQPDVRADDRHLVGAPLGPDRGDLRQRAAAGRTDGRRNGGRTPVRRPVRRHGQALLRVRAGPGRTGSRDALGRPEHPAQRAPASVPGRRRGRGQRDHGRLPRRRRRADARASGADPRSTQGRLGLSRGGRQRLGRDRSAGAPGRGHRPARRGPAGHAGRRRPGHGVRGLP